VNDPDLVRPREPGRDLPGDLDQPARRQRPGREKLSQVLSLGELHGDVVAGVHRTDLVDRHDVRMTERGSGLSLSLEAAHAVCIRPEGFRQDLDRDVAFETEVPAR
jgi:hypothetical protein